MNPFVDKALTSLRMYPRQSAEMADGSASPNLTQERWVINRDKRTGAILVDDRLRVQLRRDSENNQQVSGPLKARMTDVFAIGDTAMLDSGALPATAQVANQQAKWLAKRLNSGTHPSEWKDNFSFRNLGVMTYLGGSKAVLQGPQADSKGQALELKGRVAYLLWRGAYLTMTLSWRNKFLISLHWLAVKLFGRDVSRY